MKVMHVSVSVDRIAGGPSTAICNMALSQAKNGVQVIIFSYKTSEPIFSESPHANLTIEFCTPGTFARSLRTSLSRHQPDIIHGHGLWQLELHQMAKMARKFSIPYVITPHGTLHPWALNVKKWKKKIAMFLYQSADLKAAAALHATSETEAAYFSAVRLRNPVAVIPNGIDLLDYPLPEEKKEFKTILYLSRIHPQKGLDNLIEAWRLLDADILQDWTLEIAGEGPASYIRELQSKIKDYGLKQISLIGRQYGQEKIDTYQRASLFVLPTFSENFGIVVAEALAMGIPVITTKGTPWKKLQTHHCGWWIDLGVEPLKKALEMAMSTDQAQLTAMGRNGRTLIQSEFSISAVAQQSIALYEWIVNKSDKPNCIQ